MASRFYSPLTMCVYRSGASDTGAATTCSDWFSNRSWLRVKRQTMSVKLRLGVSSLDAVGLACMPSILELGRSDSERIGELDADLEANVLARAANELAFSPGPS
jgi:hypothetical protein